MIRLGIIGTGGMARSHARAYQLEKNVAITACCDISAERAATFASEFKIAKHYTDYREMLAKEKLDGISIVTTDATHAKIALAALEERVAVLCEKPMAVTVADAQKMLTAAKRARVIHMVNFSKRDSAGLQAARRDIVAGKIGRIMHVDAQYLQSWLVTKNWGDWRKSSTWLWRLSKRHGSGGVLADIGCHIYDMAAFLCGDIADIYCHLKTFSKAPGNRIGEYLLDANDSFVSNVTFKNGALGTVHCSRWATGRFNREYIAVYGDKGAVEVDFAKGQSLYNRFDKSKSLWETLACKPSPSNYARFVKAIATGKNDASDFVNGLKVQKYLDLSVKSDKLKKPLKVPS